MKKYKVLKSGIFLQPNNRHGEQIRPQKAVPVGEVIHLGQASAQVKMYLRFGQIEEVADDAPVTFTAN